MSWRCSGSSGPISSCLLAASKKMARLVRRWLGGCRRLPGSTGTASKNNSFPFRRRCILRRPKLNYESNATGLDRNELGMFLVQAGLAGGRDHGRACLLALNGLRISEALNTDVEHLGLEPGHRTLTITRKGGGIVTIPLAPRTARAINLCVGEREEGPIFLNHDGTRRLDRHAATRIVKRLANRGGIDKRISPRSLRHSFITAALDAGVALRDVQEAASHADPRKTMRYDRARRSLDRHAT